ncbi:GATA transcription factor 1 [Argentina anserina]|uniref:GATA transcription factor 1 n=1 Tax=Argentina anserina TaxID=57926 RepID=UPI002176889E|nr:GATA transcription factor 1 [Potentilla anserina]
MVPLDPSACLVDDLRHFLSDVADHDARPEDPSRPLIPTEEAEEELEWISNKDAFPAVETFILSEQVSGIAKNQSPVSVLENSSTNSSSACLMSSCGGLKPPHRARTKGRRRRSEIPPQQLFWNQAPIESSKPSSRSGGSGSGSASKLDMGRKCMHCGTDQTPQWRMGPHGPKTLCNACGVRYKSGRLCPEYRPASSPTFLSEMHSNSHRKVLEMRKQKYGVGMVVKPEDKG